MMMMIDEPVTGLRVNGVNVVVTLSEELWGRVFGLVVGSSEFRPGEPECWYELDESCRLLKFSKGHWTRMLAVLLDVGSAEADELAENLRIAHYLHWYSI